MRIEVFSNRVYNFLRRKYHGVSYALSTWVTYAKARIQGVRLGEGNSFCGIATFNVGNGGG